MKIVNHYGCIYRMSTKNYKKFLKHLVKYGGVTVNTNMDKFGAKKVGSVNVTTRSLQTKGDAKFLLDLEK